MSENAKVAEIIESAADNSMDTLPLRLKKLGQYAVLFVVLAGAMSIITNSYVARRFTSAITAVDEYPAISQKIREHGEQLNSINAKVDSLDHTMNAKLDTIIRIATPHSSSIRRDDTP